MMMIREARTTQTALKWNHQVLHLNMKNIIKNLEGKFLLLNFLGRWTQKCVLHLYIVHVCQDIKIFIFHDSYPYQDIHNGILTSLMLRPMMESGSEPSAQVT